MRNHSPCPLPEYLNDLAKIVGIKEFLVLVLFPDLSMVESLLFLFLLKFSFLFIIFFFGTKCKWHTHNVAPVFFVVRQHFPIILVQNKITLLQKITICKHKLVINSYLFFILGDYTDAQRSLQTVYYQAGKKPQLVINNIIA